MSLIAYSLYANGIIICIAIASEKLTVCLYRFLNGSAVDVATPSGNTDGNTGGNTGGNESGGGDNNGGGGSGGGSFDTGS